MICRFDAEHVLMIRKGNSMHTPTPWIRMLLSTYRAAWAGSGGSEDPPANAFTLSWVTSLTPRNETQADGLWNSRYAADVGGIDGSNGFVVDRFFGWPPAYPIWNFSGRTPDAIKTTGGGWFNRVGMLCGGDTRIRRRPFVLSSLTRRATWATEKRAGGDL